MPIPSCEHCLCLGDRFLVMIQVLVTLVTSNLFTNHGINMWAFLVAFGGYCVAHDINSRIHRPNSSVAADNNSPIHRANSSRISGLIVVFGSLSIVSLVSTLVPQVFGYIILSMSWICAAAFIVVVYDVGKLYKEACSWIHYNIMESVLSHIRNNNSFHEASNGMIISSPSTEQPPSAISVA